MTFFHMVESQHKLMKTKNFDNLLKRFQENQLSSYEINMEYIGLFINSAFNSSLKIHKWH